MANANETSPAGPDLDALVRAADAAFWEVVVRHFPTAKSGDLSPLATVRLARAQEAAVSEWFANNVQCPDPLAAFPLTQMENKTTSQAHTPGPWRTDSIGTDRVWILDGEGNYLAEIVAKDECGFAAPTDQQEANARLMAAAPEFARLLAVLVGDLRDIGDGQNEVYEEDVQKHLADAEALLAGACSPSAHHPPRRAGGQ